MWWSLIDSGENAVVKAHLDVTMRGASRMGRRFEIMIRTNFFLVKAIWQNCMSIVEECLLIFSVFVVVLVVVVLVVTATE